MNSDGTQGMKVSTSGKVSFYNLNKDYMSLDSDSSFERISVNKALDLVQSYSKPTCAGLVIGSIIYDSSSSGPCVCTSDGWKSMIYGNVACVSNSCLYAPKSC
jgi:hypothetical protein